MTARLLEAAGPRVGVRRAAVYAAALLATGVAAVPGHTAAAKVPALTSTVQLTGATAAGYLDVRVAKAMTYANLAASVGSAPGNNFVTVALLKPGAAATNAAGLLMQRLPGEDAWRMLGVGASPAAGIGLPAGNYRMFIVSDAPTAVTLSLNGQAKGTTRLRTLKPAKARNVTLNVLTVGNNPAPTATTLDTYTASKEFVVLAGASFEYQVRHVLRAASCTYEGQAPAATAGCANGVRANETDGLGSAQPQLTGLRVGYITSTYSAAGKTMTYGIDYATTGVLKKITRWNTWIETS